MTPASKDASSQDEEDTAQRGGEDPRIIAARAAAARPTSAFAKWHRSGARLLRGFIAGERGAPAVGRSGSLQSRASSVMAAALMIAMSLGLLGWYYSRVIAQHGRAGQQIPGASAKPEAEMSLPVLGAIQMPRMLAAGAAAMPAHPQEGRSMAADLLPRLSLEGTADALQQSCRYRPDSCGEAAKSPQQLALERRLSAAPFTRRFSDGEEAGRNIDSPASARLEAFAAVAPPELDAGAAAISQLARNRQAGSTQRRGGSTLADEMADAPGDLLQHGGSAAIRAGVLPDRRLLLPKGAFIDCTLETAIDSTLPGMTTCITAGDTFGADGKVVLLERGTKLVGETRGQVRHGAARIFVVWTEARTPTGVVVALDSPGTDELGRSGLPGKVERHFWDRFGAAILISTIDGAMQAAARSAGSGNGTVIYNPASSRDVLTEVLRETIGIPPTLVKAHGERIQILVARDLDFSRAYELHLQVPAATEDG